MALVVEVATYHLYSTDHIFCDRKILCAVHAWGGGRKGSGKGSVLLMRIRHVIHEVNGD